MRPTVNHELEATKEPQISSPREPQASFSWPSLDIVWRSAILISMLTSARSNRPILLLAAVLGWGLVAGSAVGQTPEPIGDDFKASKSSATNGQPDIGMDARGNFVVVWSFGARSAYYTRWDVWARLFAADGTPRTDDFRLHDESLDHETGADVGVAPDGRFVVVWHETEFGRQPTDLWGRRFDSSGSPMAEKFLIAETGVGTTDLTAIDVDVNPAGDFVTVWRRLSSEPATIQARRFSSDGAPLGGEFRVNTYDTEDSHFPVVHWTPDGGFVVIWVNIEGGHGQRFSSDGTPLGPPFKYHDEYARGVVNTFDVAETGEFVVTWMGVVDEVLDANWEDIDIFFRRFSSDGTALHDAVRVNTTTPGIQEFPGISMERGGEFIVVWDSPYPTATGNDDWADSIQGQRYSSTGERVGLEFQINTTTTWFQYTSTVAARPGGGFVVAWKSYEVFGESGSYNSFIRARRFGASPPFCTESETVACLNRGRFQVEVEWEDFRGGRGLGRRVPQSSDDSALFWFFGHDNWEVLVKVLDGCAINHRFWAFAAATTNVGYVLRVTDTETGAVREYTNPLGHSADAVTDTAAFATCR